MSRLKVPVQVDGFEVKRTAEGFQICGTVEVPGVGRVPICRDISDEEAKRFFRKAFDDAQAEYERFNRRGGLKAWIARYFGKN